MQITSYSQVFCGFFLEGNATKAIERYTRGNQFNFSNDLMSEVYSEDTPYELTLGVNML